jgi:hypothetical protein
MQAPEVTTESKPTELVRIAQVAPPEKPQSGRSWTDLSKTEQEIHLRAQRFARTRTAELLLRRMDAVREGRASKNVYGKLKEEIEAGRDAFRREFFAPCRSMVDYYHLELVRTLAKGDANVLGAGYPGPLP